MKPGGEKMRRRRDRVRERQAEEIQWLRHLCGEAGRIIGWHLDGRADEACRLLCWAAGGYWRRVKKELEK